MSMNEELKQAAERLLNPHRVSDQFQEMMAQAYRIADDYTMLAEAYLREHPSDDDTPIDEAWLRSVGFAERPEYPCGIWLDGLRYMPKHKNWLWCETIMARCTVCTRGELRRLCSALGVTLKGGARQR